MKPGRLLFIFVLWVNTLTAQENKKSTGSLTVESYIDFTKHGAEAAYWMTYDHKKISLEARYGYDFKRNISIYAGPLIQKGNWKLRVLPGVTFGNKTGFSFSPPRAGRLPWRC